MNTDALFSLSHFILLSLFLSCTRNSAPSSPSICRFFISLSLSDNKPSMNFALISLIAVASSGTMVVDIIALPLQYTPDASLAMIISVILSEPPFSVKHSDRYASGMTTPRRWYAFESCRCRYRVPFSF